MSNILCGKILRPHGIHGSIKCILYETQFTANDKIYIDNFSYTISECANLSSNFFKIKLYQINTFLESSKFRNYKIYCNRKPLSENHIYYQDLINFIIFDTNNEKQCFVQDIIINKQQAYLLTNKNLYIPVPSNFITNINFKDKRITCESLIFDV